MTSSEFNLLSQKEKGIILFTDGEFLETRKVFRFRVNLYSLHGFYVETWHSKTNDKFIDIKTIKKSDIASHYNRQINSRSSQQLSIDE